MRAMMSMHRGVSLSSAYVPKTQIGHSTVNAHRSSTNHSKNTIPRTCRNSSSYHLRIAAAL